MSAKVKMYSTRFCPYCIRARMMLESKGIEFEDIGVDGDPERRREMMELSGRRTVPQIWVGDTHVGGYDDLAALEYQGALDELLEMAPQASWQ
jgi:glutaredoxin 3